MPKRIMLPHLRYSMTAPAEMVKALQRIRESHLSCCHLIEQAKSNLLTIDEIKGALMRTGSVLESDHLDVDIAKCQQCGQLFAYCFYEYTSPGGDDDCWSFWIPINDEEAGEIRTRKPLRELIGEIVHNRPLICRRPDRSLSWNERGLPFIP
ncbi:MAG TPA: hypothetical protein PLS25_07950 [Methanoregulaceae archaeon]|nr:hypothetical protein [Methanoregulaceae archaeon]